MARYDDDKDVDARWYLDHGWPHDAADLLAHSGSIMAASEAEYQSLKPLIELQGLRALYIGGEIYVFTDTEAAELLRELELDQDRRGPVAVPAPAPAPGRIPHSRRST
jgi:hypothetical protein